MVNIHVRREFAHDHVVDETRDVNIGWETVAHVLVVRRDHRLDGVKIVVDVSALGGGDHFGLRGMVDVIHLLPIIVGRCAPRRCVSSGELVGLDDVAAGDIWGRVVGGVHLDNVHAFGVYLDLFGEEIEPAVVAVDNHLAVFCAGRIVSKLCGKDVGEVVAHVGWLVVHGVEHPVVLGGQP